MLLGVLLVPMIWIFVKVFFAVSDRYLPAPLAVLQATKDIRPSVFVHLFYTSSRLVIGYSLGVVIGIGWALLMVRFQNLRALLTPSIQAMRSIPAPAVIPFFLLWFGFSETGRYLIVLSAVSFNVTVASMQILAHKPESHAAFFHSFALQGGSLSFSYALPRIAEAILPTLRFSLALAIGAVTVSELLGSQVGLGYLIQSSRSTFSLHVLFLSTILLGCLSAVADLILRSVWNHFVFWRSEIEEP